MSRPTRHTRRGRRQADPEGPAVAAAALAISSSAGETSPLGSVGSSWCRSRPRSRPRRAGRRGPDRGRADEAKFGRVRPGLRAGTSDHVGSGKRQPRPLTATMSATAAASGPRCWIAYRAWSTPRAAPGSPVSPTQQPGQFHRLPRRDATPARSAPPKRKLRPVRYAILGLTWCFAGLAWWRSGYFTVSGIGVPRRWKASRWVLVGSVSIGMVAWAPVNRTWLRVKVARCSSRPRKL